MTSEAGPEVISWRNVGSKSQCQPSQVPGLCSHTNSAHVTHRIWPEVRPQVSNPSIRCQIYINPAGKSMVIHQSIPPRRLPPHPTSFVRKNLKSADIWCPKFYGSLPSCWAEAENETPRFFQPKHGRAKPKETPRFEFSNQNMAGPSQKRRHASNSPTKTQAGQAK